MKVTVRFPFQKDLFFKRDISLETLLKELQICPDDVIVLRNGKAINEQDAVFEEDDEVEIYPVVSGG